MAGIIKNQILKHLSRYVKNLSSDKINLSTFKGEGELRNLELDEAVMTELLALPTWMKLTHATCNHVLIRIPWTKLKSVPIHLSLDEVNIRVEACETLREGGGGGGLPAPAFGKYGFVNKVIDGITATVNSVEITFNSREFESKVQIARIRVESRAPDWSRVDLSGTRLKDMLRGETLIFKEMEWQTLRLEARSTLDRHLAPLRLLANQAKARIVIKKKLSDSQVLGCRLSLILDDLLWVLTDSQILAALHFVSSLSGLVKQATETTQRIKAARKLETLPEYQAQQSQATAGDVIRTAVTRFDSFDVKETSYHFVCEKIDLHFCDDPGSGRSQHPDLREGGALQLSLNQVMIDFYPYHLAKGSRKFWQKYSSNNTLELWLQKALLGFKISLVDALTTGSMHSPLTRTNLVGQGPLAGESNPVKEEVTKQLGKLMSTCLIVKVQDMCLYRLTTASKRTSPLPFISTFIERPKDLPVIHTEFSWFYYPGEICFPLPSPKIYAYLHPIQIHLDVCTILWLNAFVTNLQSSMAGVNPTNDSSYVDVRVEALMPKIIFENTADYPGQKERPRSLHINVSRLVLSNYRSSETGTLHQLTQSIELLQRGDLIYGSDFPSKDTDAPLLQEKFVKHAEGQDKLRMPRKLNFSSFTEVASDLTQEFLWTDPRDVWFISLDPCWADFHVVEKRRHPSESDSAVKRKGKSGMDEGKTVNTLLYPFIDSVPISAWVYVDETVKADGSPNSKNIHAIFGVSGTAKAQLTHYQFLFVMRMVEAFGELSLYLTLDSKAIVGDINNLVTFVGYINSLDFSLLFPPAAEAKREDSQSLDTNSANQESCSANCDNQEDAVKPPELEFRKCNVFHKPFSSTSGSTSPMARSIHGGSYPNLGAEPGNGLHGMSQNAKHSLTNLVVSFNKGGAGVSTPDSEVVSNWSNISSDSSDNFVQLDVGNDGVTSIINPNREEEEEPDSEVEVAIEAEDNSFIEDRPTPSPVGMSQEISITRMNQDNSTTSVLTLKLQGIEIGQEGRELSSIIKLQCKAVGLQEWPDIVWKDFQDAFCGRKRSGGEVSELLHGSPTQRRAVKLRLSQKIDGDSFLRKMSSDEVLSIIKEITSSATPRVNLMDRPGAASPIRNEILQATSPSLKIKADFTNCAQFKLLTSTCAGLADLLEDEIIPTPIPMALDVVGLHMELVEDKPSANITSPGTVPVKIRIPSSLHISRDETGVFQIGLPQTQASEPRNTELVANSTYPVSDSHDDKEKEYLRKELERVHAQLQLSQQRNAALENEHEENGYLRGLVANLQDEVMKLQAEAMQLLHQLKQSHNLR